MSSRRAARKIDSPSRISTSRSSMKKVLGFGAFWSLISASSSPTSHRLGEFIREKLQDAQQRVWRRLAQAADRRVLHQLGKLGEQADVPRPLLHQFRGLLAADAARRALAAAFVLEEAHQVERHGLH